MSKSSIRTFAPKVTPITYESPNVPKSTSDFYEVFTANSSVTYKRSNEYQVNVLPDLTPILCAIIREARNIRPDLTSINNAKVSPYTFVAYCLNLVYAHFLFHDLEINPQDSPYARKIMTNPDAKKYIDSLLALPVPKCLDTFLMRNQTTFLDSQPHVIYTPSMNGHSHYLHFGRIFPINLFTTLHDVVSSANARAAPDHVHYDYFQSEIFEVTTLILNPLHTTQTTAKVTYTPSNYFAKCIRPASQSTTSHGVTQSQYYASKLSQMLGLIFEPTEIRAYKSEARYTEVGLAPVTVPHGMFNPYDVYMCLGLTSKHSNIHELATVWQSVSSVLTEKKLCEKNFASYFPQSGAALLVHGYSNFPVPHFDAYNFINAYSDSDVTHTPFKEDPANATFVRIHDDTFADLIQFKTATESSRTTWSTRNNHLLLLMPTLARATPAQGQTARVTITVSSVNASLARTTITNDSFDFDMPATQTEYYPEAIDPEPTIADVTDTQLVNGQPRIYTSEDDEYPNVKIVDHLARPQDAHLSLLHGLIIYHDELAASIVPAVNAEQGPNDDNAMFLQSSVPMSMCHFAINFRSHEPHPSRCLARKKASAAVQPAANMLRNPNVVYDNTLARYSFDTGYQRQNYGLTTTTDQAIPFYNATFFGSNVATVVPRRRAPLQPSEPANMPYSHLLCWSPYTFVDATLDHPSSDYSAEALKKIHFLTNLRTILGTRTQVYDAASPIASIPV